MKKAVVLLSGGIDSTTVLYYAKSLGYDVDCLSFKFGQRHEIEVEFAQYHAKKTKSAFNVVDLTGVSQTLFSSSSLTNKNIELENATDVKSTDIPSSYVPSRNLLFLSFAASYAESKGVNDIFIGVNVVDYSNYPDCREEFIKVTELAINKGSKMFNEGSGRINIQTPILNLTKSEIIQMGSKLGVEYKKTISCYNPNALGQACGVCLSCDIRKKGFLEAEIEDVTVYFK